ncbi:acyltransferase [Mycobacterium sp. CBMA271]|uniref:acyltransferase family protein n=1 Tax=unclassified Mycobacteroides TaxID=2618759 RepID=UPI0012DF5D43|nr:MULTISPECIES: acyltransferase [unclassified Mycobacteroides]MUM16652.1 acyltransferase [Mycobacteroides sp. CBMA 326]MUM22038.1 acyltransferase [Mycobacteroides sp. CBMA 271]
MTMTLGLPTADEVGAATPTTRDRALDVIRIVSLVGVVLGHTIMAVSTIDNGVLLWGNLLNGRPIFQALTWVFQIMPLFFFAGVAASVGSWKPGTSWGSWLMHRCTRLYRPVFYYLGFWALALLILRQILPVHVYEPVAGVSTQLLWFLGAYVLVLAAIPLLARITTTRAMCGALAGIYLSIAAVDVLRLGLDAPKSIGYVNFVVWLLPAVLGVGYRRQLITQKAALLLAAAVFAVNIALVTFGPYTISLVGVAGQKVPNMIPPSLVLAGHAIVLSALAIAAMPAINRWAQRPRVWWAVAIGNSGAMTLYLWHMPALLGMHLAFDFLGFPRYDTAAPDFMLLSALQVVTMIALVAGLFLALRPLENNPLPGWDGGYVAHPGIRSAVVGVALMIAGGGTLASVVWGLKGFGLACWGIVLVGLVIARALASDKRS